MAEPLQQTKDVFNPANHVRKVEFLPRPNLLADFKMNLNTEVLLQTVRDLFETAVGTIRVEGLNKTYSSTGAAGTPATGKLTVIAPEAIADGETFTLDDGTGEAVFEYDKNAVWNPANNRIDISTAVTVEEVRIATELAIAAINIGTSPTRSQAPYNGGAGIGGDIDLVALVNPATTADVAAQNVRITDNVRDERFTHVGMRSANSQFATGRINVPAPTDILDGETFTIQGDSNPDQVFEFDSDSVVVGGHLSIDLTAIATDVLLRARVVTAINAQTGLTGVIAVASDIAAAGYVTAIDPSKIVETETFTLHDGSVAKVFEFDTDSSVVGSNVPVHIASATDMQDVRAAIIAAVNGAGIDIAASTPGFGPKVELTNTADIGQSGNQPVTDTVANVEFAVGDMTGGIASVFLRANAGGPTKNRALSTTVATPLFAIEGMAKGIGAGWDITPGEVIFDAYRVSFDEIVRCPAVVGAQNFLKVRVIERRLTIDTDPDIVQLTLSGAGFGDGPNEYRWRAVVLIESGGAPPYELVDNEVSYTDAVLCEFDAVNGQTIVAGSELAVRVSKLGSWIEPSPVDTRVAKAGDTMTGALVTPEVDVKQIVAGAALLSSNADAEIPRHVVPPRMTGGTMVLTEFLLSDPGVSLEKVRIYVGNNGDLRWTRNAIWSNDDQLWTKDLTGVDAVQVALCPNPIGGGVAFIISTKLFSANTPWTEDYNQTAPAGWTKIPAVISAGQVVVENLFSPLGIIKGPGVITGYLVGGTTGYTGPTQDLAISAGGLTTEMPMALDGEVTSIAMRTSATPTGDITITVAKYKPSAPSTPVTLFTLTGTVAALTAGRHVAHAIRTYTAHTDGDAAFAAFSAGDVLQVTATSASITSLSINVTVGITS